MKFIYAISYLVPESPCATFTTTAFSLIRLFTFNRICQLGCLLFNRKQEISIFFGSKLLYHSMQVLFNRSNISSHKRSSARINCNDRRRSCLKLFRIIQWTRILAQGVDGSVYALVANRNWHVQSPLIFFVECQSGILGQI